MSMLDLFGFAPFSSGAGRERQSSFLGVPWGSLLRGIRKAEVSKTDKDVRIALLGLEVRERL